jgi:hypothetical protein
MTKQSARRRVKSYLACGEQHAVTAMQEFDTMKTILVLVGGADSDELVFETAHAAALPFAAHLNFLGSPAEFMGEIGVSLIVLSLWIYGQHKRCCPQIHRRNNKRKSLESEIEGAIVDVRKN